MHNICDKKKPWHFEFHYELNLLNFNRDLFLTWVGAYYINICTYLCDTYKIFGVGITFFSMITKNKYIKFLKDRYSK